MADRPIAELVEAMRAAASGSVEWRVQHPIERSYCISFSYSDCVNPERAANEWLAEHRRRNPGGLYVDYEVARCVVLDTTDRLLIEAADALLELAKAKGV